MALCRFTGGIDFNCDSLKKIGGIKKVWLFNLSDLRSPIGTNAAGYVTSLEFTGYDGLYLFDARKYSHQFTSTPTRGDGGNVSWVQELVLRVFNDTPTEDQTISDLAVADVGAIIQDNNGQFFVGGALNGMNLSTGSAGTGRQAGDDTATSLTLQGAEQQMWLRFNRGNFSDTLAYIQALVF